MKEKIIQEAIRLFNLKGFFDVKMRDISTALNISVGSVTYHFNNKEALMDSIYRYMIKTLDEMSISDYLFQQEGEEANVAKIYFAYMQKFRFFFQDTLDIIRAFPEIGKKHQEQVRAEINIVKNILYMQVGKRTLIPEPITGLYDTLAESIWQTLHFWFVRERILGDEDETLGLNKILEVITHLVYPYLTESRKAKNVSIIGIKNDALAIKI